MKALTMLISLMLIGTLGWADAPTPTTPWQQLQQLLIQKQNFVLKGGYYVLAHVVPSSPEQTHQSDYLMTTILIPLPDGSVVPGYVRSVSETWTKTKDGNWDIDQWKHTLDRNGHLTDVTHIHLVETDNGSILSGGLIRAGEPTDPIEIARWTAILQRWEAQLGLSSKSQISELTALSPSL